MSNYDLIVIGAGPGGLMAARTAARDGLKVLLLEQRKEISDVKRYCSQLIRIGPGGFSSAKAPSDIEIKKVNLTLEVDHSKHSIRLMNVDDEVRIDYNGTVGFYHNETWVSPGGFTFNSEESSELIYGFQIDKRTLIGGLLDECIKDGCTVRSETRCVDVEDGSEGVSVKVRSGKSEETIKAGRVIIADGAFSPLVEKLGFNKGRPEGPPNLKFLAYIIDRMDSNFPESRHLKLVIPSLHKGQISIGRWAHNTVQVSSSTPLVSKVKLSDVFDRLMKNSPFASWFSKSKIIEKLGCNMPLRPAIWEPAKGKIICCGDNSAYAETAIKGALGCGHKAAKSSKTGLQGGDGAREYNDYWQHAFSFHSAQYRSFGKQILPPARVLNDSETDILYKWLQDNNLYGMPGDVLTDNMARFKSDLPQIAEKVISKGGRPGT